MMRSILSRTIYDKRWFLVGWSLALALIGLLMVTMQPSLAENMDALVSSMPDQLKGLVGDATTFSNYDLYIATQQYEIRVAIFLMIFCLILGLSLSVGYEEKGTMRTILASRQSRLKSFYQTWLAGVLTIIVILASLALVTYLASFLIDQHISFGLITKISLLTSLLGASIFSLVYATAMASGRRLVATTLGTIVLIVSFIITTAGAGVDWLKSLEKFSLLHYYTVADLVKGDFAISSIIVLTGLLAASLIVGYMLYRSRDIN